MGKQIDMLNGSLGDKIIRYAVPLAFCGISVQRIAGSPVRIFAGVWGLVYPGLVFRHRNLRSPSDLDFYCFPNVTRIFHNYAGLSGQLRGYGVCHIDCYLVCKAI